MNFLLGVVGIEVAHEKEVIHRLNRLQDMGVNSVFTIQEYEEEKLTEKQIKVLER